MGNWDHGVRLLTNMWYAALHTGQDPNNIKDEKAVFAAWKEQRGMIKKYWASGSELMSLWEMVTFMQRLHGQAELD